MSARPDKITIKDNETKKESRKSGDLLLNALWREHPEHMKSLGARRVR